MVSILQSMPCLAAAWKDITLYWKICTFQWKAKPPKSICWWFTKREFRFWKQKLQWLDFRQRRPAKVDAMLQKRSTRTFLQSYKAESHTYQSFGDFPQYARRCLFFLYCIFGTMWTEKDSAIRWWRRNHSPKTEYAILFEAAFEGRADYLFSRGYWTSGWATGAVHRGFSRRKTTAYWGFTDQVSILW